MPRISEAAFNVELANVLRGKNPRWLHRIGAEQSEVFEQRALRPDILVDNPGGLPVAVETEFLPAGGVEEDARRRLGLVVGDLGAAVEQSLAVRVPVSLRQEQGDLARRIQSAEFAYCVFSLAETEPARWPASGWIRGGADDLAACIERVSVSERLIAKGIEILERRVRQAARRVLTDSELGFDGPLLEMAELLHQEPGEQTARMAMAILANALIFHNSIAGAHRLKRIDEIRDGLGDISPRLIQEQWRHVLRNINYWPIFEIASAILGGLRASSTKPVVALLAGAAGELSNVGVTSLHDMSGRMFQRLIVDRKFLATFYTLPVSAALLGELAVSRMRCDWSSGKALAALRIADLACGTGTLISAAYQAVLGRHRRAGGNDARVHAAMIERSLVAADIMPAATHLAASMLSSAHPGLKFRRTRVLTMPYGRQADGRPLALGSLDLITEEVARPLFGTGRRVASGDRPDAEDCDGRDEVALEHGAADLVIMNPPFTRPTNHESSTVPVPSFAGFEKTAEEQRAMARHLARIRGALGTAAGHGNAGIASNFVDLAHAKARPGGVVALVLPIAAVSGVAWRNMRALLARHYCDLTVVTLAVSGDTARAFSADTGMAEALVVATRKRDDSEASGDTMFVSLYQRPESLAAAAETARVIATLTADSRSGRLRIGDSEVGSFVRAPLSEGGCARVREPRLAHAMMSLRGGLLSLPRLAPCELPVALLGELGDRGPLHRDVSGAETGSGGRPRGPFEVVPLEGTPIQAVPYPMLWAHSAERERRLVVEPDTTGEPRPGCADRAIDLWKRTAGRLHFNLDFQLNSQCLAACLTQEPAMGGRAWPTFLLKRAQLEQALALCANSTLGLMAFWWIGSRQQEGRSVVTIKSLPGLPVLDVRALDDSRVDVARSAFDSFRRRTFLPANEAYRDETRHALDRFVLVDLFGLSEAVLEPLAVVRAQWCAEPSVHGGKASAIQ